VAAQVELYRTIWFWFTMCIPWSWARVFMWQLWGVQCL